MAKFTHLRQLLLGVSSLLAGRLGPTAALAAGTLATLSLLALAPAAQAQVPAGTSHGPFVGLPPTAAMSAACGTGSSSACQGAVVAAIDQAREAEGIGPLALPAGYATMSAPGQLLVLANAERVARGLPAFVGLSGALDNLAEQGAVSGTDPNGPSGADWGSNWAGGEGSVLLADYDWMYYDGPGSPNLDCPSASSSGCWAHRENILGNYGPHPWMGAAEASVKGVTSMAELFSSAA